MKRLVVVLSGLLVLPAFAEVAPFFYDDALEYSDAEYVDDGVLVDDGVVVADEDVAPVAPVINTNPRVAASSRNGLRSAPTANVASNRTTGVNSRVTAARTTTSRTAVPSRVTTTRGTVSRVATNNTTTGGVSARRATTTGGANTARAGTTTTTATTTMTTSTGQTTGVYENNNLYTGRVGVRSSASARVPAIRVASATMTTSASDVSAAAKETASTMDAIKELSDYCKAQYTACMDNFCNVLDDNQGRCSCSKNVKNYEKTETALKAATEELQEVAQKIQYIGLSKDEITTLFSETEAESAMRGQSDSSQIKASLDKIKNMIVDVKTGTASSVTADSGMSFDLSNLLDFTISSSGFDLSALFGTTTSNNTSSIGNQRGETLYKTAAARCKAAVLTDCISNGVDAAVITNSYDMEIDKQCIAYERSLSDANDEMSATVRNAKTVLQKARLMVAQQKNSYDLRGCISALDSCMQDDYVCGADYEYCLDPSGKYIVDGAIVVGSLPGKVLTQAAKESGILNEGLYQTWTYTLSGSNAISPWDGRDDQSGNLASYITATLTSDTVENVDSNMSKFLQYKIGYNAGGKNYGMCMSVLNKCQDYTYSSGTYVNNNRIIEEFLYRTLPRIKAGQDALLSSYAETCISDVTSCLSSNNYRTDGGASANNIALNACRNIIQTCMSVNGNVLSAPTPGEISTWAKYVYSAEEGSDANSVQIQNYTYCITNIEQDGTGVATEWDETAKSCTCNTGYSWTGSATALGSCEADS